MDADKEVSFCMNRDVSFLFSLHMFFIINIFRGYFNLLIN